MGKSYKRWKLRKKKKGAAAVVEKAPTSVVEVEKPKVTPTKKKTPKKKGGLWSRKTTK